MSPVSTGGTTGARRLQEATGSPIAGLRASALAGGNARIVQVPTASATHFLVKLDLAAPANFLSAAAVLQDAVASV